MVIITLTHPDAAKETALYYNSESEAENMSEALALMDPFQFQD